MNRKNFHHYIFIFFLMIVFLLMLFYIIFSSGKNSKLDKYYAKMEKQGKKVSVEAVRKEMKSNEKVIKILEDNKKIIPSVIDNETSETYGTVYNTAGQDWGKLTDTDKDYLRKYISMNHDAFTSLVNAARHPDASLINDISTLSWYWIDTKSIQRYNKISKLSVLYQGKLFLEEGKTSEALTCAKNGLIATNIYINTPTIITVLSGYTILNNSLNIIQEALSGKYIDNESAQELIALNSYPNLKTYFVNAINMDKLATDEALHKLLEGDEYISKIYFPFNDKFYFLKGTIVFAMSPIIKEDILFINEKYDLIIDAGNYSYNEAMQNFKKIENQFQNLSKIHYVAAQTFPNFTKFYKQTIISQAKIDITNLSIACKIFKNKNKSFPDNLSQLAPDILKEIPLDPFTNNDYIYARLSNGGFIIYTPTDSNDDTIQSLDDFDFISKQRFSAIFPAQLSQKDTSILLWYEKPKPDTSD